MISFHVEIKIDLNTFAFYDPLKSLLVYPVHPLGFAGPPRLVDKIGEELSVPQAGL